MCALSKRRSRKPARAGGAGLLLGILLALPLLAACGDDGDAGGDVTLTVYAAASLTASLSEMGDAFEAANPGVRVEFNFAGSQALATQIIEGASADVFASANTTQMDRAVEAGVVGGEPVVFARNRLALIVPAENPAGIASVYDLGDPDIKLVLAAGQVPAGRYAREMLAMLEGSREFRERHPRFSEFNIVSNETSVLLVVTRVGLGEADAGIVYETDVRASSMEDIEVIPIPEDLNVIADYPIAPVGSGDGELATGFIEFTRSDEGWELLAGWGFLPIEPE